MVGAAGFEPTTSRPPAGRATKLRHAPQIFFCNIIYIEYIIIKILTPKKNMQIKELKQEASRLRDQIVEILRNV